MKLLLAEPRITILGQIDLKKCVITITDGASKSCTVKLGEGNCSWTEKVNREYVKDRGVLDIVRDGDEEPLDFNLEATWEYIVGTESVPSFNDIVKGGPEYTSVVGDACQPYACKITIVYTPTPSTCGDMETYVFDKFRYEQLSMDLRGGTISMQGKCNITAPAITRTAQA